MPIALTFATLGADEIGSTLIDISRTTDDWRGAWPVVAAVFRRQMAQHFASEGVTGRSGHWAALSAPYAAWKNRHFPGRKILELTGRLMGSLTDGSHADAVTSFGALWLFVGSNVPYAAFHQSGTPRMPRRPPISPANRDAAEWTAAMWRYMNSRIASRVGRFSGKFAGAMS